MKKKTKDILAQIELDIITNPGCIRHFPQDLLEKARALLEVMPEIDINAPIE